MPLIVVQGGDSRARELYISQHLQSRVEFVTHKRDLQNSQFGCLKEIFKFRTVQGLVGLGNTYEKMGLCCQESQKLFAPEQEKIGICLAQLPTLYL